MFFAVLRPLRQFFCGLCLSGCLVTSTLAQTVGYTLSEHANTIQFQDKKSLETFYSSWKNTTDNKFSILYIGDSHLQTEVLPGRVRKHLQKELGDGGIGLMRSFSTVKTYSPITYYSTRHEGEWTGRRNFENKTNTKLGVGGMTCRTLQERARIVFDFAYKPPTNHTKLRIYCQKTPNAFDFVLRIDNQAEIPITTYQSPELPYIEVIIPPVNDQISLETVRHYPEQNEFEFYQLDLQTLEDSGVVLHNAGVGGARFYSVLQESLLAKQINYFQPDLVIVDLGTNDYLYDDIIQPELEGEIRQVVNIIKSNVPSSSIILTTTQDMSWKGTNRRSGPQFCDMIYRVAREMNCGVWDWFQVSGGQGTIRNWYINGLAQKDQIHLSPNGYELKGDLLYKALKATIDWIDQHPNDQQHLLPVFMPYFPAPIPTPIDSIATTVANQATPSTTSVATTPKPAPTPPKPAPIYHTIKNGDTLSSIARKYGITVQRIQQLNHHKGDIIRVGERLRVK